MLTSVFKLFDFPGQIPSFILIRFRLSLESEGGADSESEMKFMQFLLEIKFK